MPAVEFHILSEAGDTARLRYACQLVEHADQHGQRCYVYVASDDQAKRMDELLWTFRDQAFIPHELISAASPTHPRIKAIIGSSPTPPEAFQSLVINVSDALPEAIQNCVRIYEVIDADPLHKQLARERYRQYRERGCQLETKNQ